VQEKLTKSQVKDRTNLQGMAPIFWSVFIGKKIKQSASKKRIIINKLAKKIETNKR
jgi:hypothetical protein